MYFSVINDKWIPVTYMDNTHKEISIRDAFEKAETIKEISADFEMSNLAVIRLLVAFYMDIYRPETKEDRENDLIKISFDIVKFDKYVNECNKDGECFNLFDEKRPFLQTGMMNVKNGLKAISNISDITTSGTETTFFGGKNENRYSFTPAECALSLCTKMATVFKSKQGTGYLAFTPLQNAIFMLNKGKNLKETIILNAIAKKEWLSTETFFKYGTEEGMKGPFWKQGVKKDLNGELVEMEYSLLSMMTFMPVNIKLIPEENGMVKKVAYTSKKYANKKDEKNPERDPIELFKDPMVILKRVDIKENEKKKIRAETIYKTLEYDQSVGFWETIEALHIGNGKTVFKPMIIPESNTVGKVEVWSACKNGDGKGVVLHDMFDIKMNLFNIDEAEIIDDSESFKNIIYNFNNKSIKKAFENVSVKLASRYINDIQKEFRLYMSNTYFDEYIPKLNECEDVFEASGIKDEYKNKTILQFKEIALNYVKKFPSDFQGLIKQEECVKEINKYFKKFKNES